MTTMTTGNGFEKPSEAFRASVAMTSDAMARARKMAVMPSTVPSGRYSSRGDGALDEVDDRLRGRARGEDLGDPELLQLRDVLIGDRPPDGDDDVARVLLAQQLDHARDERHVRAGEDREPDGVGVLLQHGLDDLLGRLVQARVDHLHAGVAECAGDDLRPAVVAVEAGLGPDDADLSGRSGHGPDITRTSYLTSASVAKRWSRATSCRIAFIGSMPGAR